MKKIFTLIVGLLAILASFATTITAVQSNNWTDKATWDLNRVPKNGDTIIIPTGITVTLDKNRNLKDVVVIIYGTLKLDNGNLNLDQNSKVIVESVGLITGQSSKDQISIDGVLKFSGTQGTQTGYSFADVNTGTAPNGFVFGALPVKFLSFYANKQGSAVALSWSTANETNNQYFDIQKSNDGRSWKTIGMVMGAMNAASVNTYHFSDKDIRDADMYYRIRQVDANGQYSYSVVKVIRSTASVTKTTIYASSKNTVSVDFNQEVKGNVVVKLVSLNGQVVASQIFNNPSYRVSLNVQNANGLYVVQVTDGNGWNEVKKVVF